MSDSGFARLPEPPYIAVIFSSRRNGADPDVMGNKLAAEAVDECVDGVFGGRVNWLHG